MQSADFHKIIKDPLSLDKSSVAELQKLVEDFPYFQSAHLLLSLASKKWDASIYQQSLKKTAIVMPNRSHLFNLIHALENNPGPSVKQAEVKEEKTSVPDKQTEAVQELDILKAAEVSVAQVEETKAEVPVVKESRKMQPEEAFEREIEKQVVESFVEKEILKTQDLHKPIAAKEEPESFGAWLSFLKKNNGQSYGDISEEVNKAREKKERNVENTPKEEKPKTDSRKLKNLAIIDKIIEKNPGLIRTREEQKFYAPDLKAKESLLENEHLVTETLARIYALQGSVNKAVRAYEILSLKYPQKSAYFASLIQKLKNNS